ncbi:hypothetical protein [Chromobacterium sp. CV08]|uniref:hypothetical protein n=1 Tax=Chromobacterium sp. CV08 TaxID=3133274 RepID=UPI003DA8E176
MKPDSLSLFFQRYLGRQRRRCGIDPAEALARLNEVMQWQAETEAPTPAKKTAGREARPEEGMQEKKSVGPRLRAG